MKQLSSRTAGFTDSVIRRMTRVSNQYGAVNLSQGFPDFNPPKALLDRLSRVAYEDKHQYSITWGAQNLREALARKQSRFMAHPVDPDSEIVITCGSTEAMMCAVMTVTDPGDKIIVFSPFYENYGADVILSGADPIYVPLYPPAFNFKAEDLEAAFRQNPKALILCNPSNPSGKVFTREELLFIAELAERYANRTSATMPTSSPTRSTSISSISRTSTCILPRCPACGSAHSAAPPSPRPTPSPVGAWATSLPRRRSSTLPARCTTSSPWARPRRCRRQ